MAHNNIINIEVVLLNLVSILNIFFTSMHNAQLSGRRLIYLNSTISQTPPKLQTQRGWLSRRSTLAPC